MLAVRNNIAKVLSRTLAAVFDEFVYGGHLLSIGASAIVLTVLILIDKPVSLPLMLIAYLVTQIVYMADHRKDLDDGAIDNRERSKHLRKIEKIYSQLIIGYIALLTILLVFFSNINTVIFVSFLGLLGCFYPKNITKNIVGFKNFYVASLWAISSVVLPYVYFSVNIDTLFYYVFSFVLLRWLINTTFFDLKDINGDKKEGLKTFPVTIGARNTLLLLSVYNIISGIILIYALQNKAIAFSACLLLFLMFYSFYYIIFALKAKPEAIRKISYIMVDGEYVLWPGLLFIGSLVFK